MQKFHAASPHHRNCGLASLRALRLLGSRTWMVAYGVATPSRIVSQGIDVCSHLLGLPYLVGALVFNSHYRGVGRIKRANCAPRYCYRHCTYNVFALGTVLLIQGSKSD